MCIRSLDHRSSRGNEALKAAEGCRSLRRWRAAQNGLSREASWSAAALCRFRFAERGGTNRMRWLLVVLRFACILASVATLLKAEEKMGSVQTALSSVTINGYVNTSAEWNTGTGNTGAAPAAVRASASYAVGADTVDSGGNISASANYAVQGSIGGFGGTSSSSAEVNRHGYIGQLYEVRSLNLSARPATINEGDTRQLDATANLDDGTVLPLTGSEARWRVLNGPIASVDSSGLATAGFVYQDSPATIRADFFGSFGTLALTVINVGHDDFGAYAGDGIADEWQVRYFGIDNPKAAPDRDADGDGQSNLFEYKAGLDPINARSRFKMSISPVPGHPSQKRIAFSPCLPDRTYTVQYRTNFSSGPFIPLRGGVQYDNDGQRTVIDTNAAGGTRFYRINISQP
jgi:hypothetical protein